jgi:hypothetical protein
LDDHPLESKVETERTTRFCPANKAANWNGSVSVKLLPLPEIESDERFSEHLETLSVPLPGKLEEAQVEAKSSVRKIQFPPEEPWENSASQ